MNGSEFKEVETLGKLRISFSALEDAAPSDEEARKLFHESRRLLRKALLRQWAVVETYVDDDDI